MFIYKITNIINDKIYIGYTQNKISHRWKKHIYDAKVGCEYLMHKAIRKYGVENFTIEQVCKCKNLKGLKRMEIFFIKKFDSMNPKKGYNMTLGGDGSKPMEERYWITNELINKTIKSDEEIPIGFRRGRKKNTKEENEKNRQTHLKKYKEGYVHPNVTITNGLVDKKLKTEKQLPDGFVFGSKNNFVIDIQRYKIRSDSELLKHIDLIKQIFLKANQKSI
jgi:group I intron endonuclease